MKYGIWSTLAPLALASIVLSAKIPLSSLKNGASLPGGIVPNKFIVELSAPLGNTKRDIVSREVSAL